MTDLSEHIEHLLRRHDCVALPGMGAFLAEYSPAKVDAAASVMLPVEGGQFQQPSSPR